MNHQRRPMHILGAAEETEKSKTSIRNYILYLLASLGLLAGLYEGYQFIIKKSPATIVSPDKGKKNKVQESTTVSSATSKTKKKKEKERVVVEKKVKVSEVEEYNEPVERVSVEPKTPKTSKRPPRVDVHSTDKTYQRMEGN